MRLDGRILLLLAGALLATSFARYIDVANNSPNYGRSNSILAARGDDDDNCRAICSPKTACCFAGTNQRRDLKLYDLETSSNIRPRTLQPVTGSDAKKKYVIRVTDNPNTIQVFTAQTGASNSAVFRDLRTAVAPVNIGIVGLCGCTALLIVHPDAVYFAHYFEDLSFQANPGDPPANFQANVINFLNNGLPGYDSLVQHTALFNSDETRIFLMSPRRTASTYLYNVEITQLKARVAAILPNAQVPTELPYKPLNMGSSTDQTLMDTTALGRALFEWDPNAGAPQTRVWLQDYKFGDP
ncbi:MAG: hypothetical protein M1813_005105 [Trichoglossum hirsutum]|nr:MAG: hypothetical protein M1813_005105 [Trichoglossum hirsutum]